MMCKQLKIADVPAGQDPRWQAVVARDRNFVGHFYYAVKTTGVYCRPSCPARGAKPGNVSFHLTPRDAEQAGFRPCKRCNPDKPQLVERHAAKVAGICRGIESAGEIPSLGYLARKRFMEHCQKIGARKLKEKIGTRLAVIVDQGGARSGVDRTTGDAPEIDGKGHIVSRRPLRQGDIVTLKIARVGAYDLHGTAV